MKLSKGVKKYVMVMLILHHRLFGLYHKTTTVSPAGASYRLFRLEGAGQDLSEGCYYFHKWEVVLVQIMKSLSAK